MIRSFTPQGGLHVYSQGILNSGILCFGNEDHVIHHVVQALSLVPSQFSIIDSERLAYVMDRQGAVAVAVSSSRNSPSACSCLPIQLWSFYGGGEENEPYASQS